MQVVHNHPFHSPRNGTDIDPQNQMALLMCPNQSKCIVPELQLQAKFKVYFCQHATKQGVRFFFLAREGFLLHPNIEMVSNIMSADYVVYLPGSAPWHLTECTNASYASKMIVLDEFDGAGLFYPADKKDMDSIYGKNVPWYFMYFKRSFVRRSDGEFIGYPSIEWFPDVYPMTYSIAETYVQTNKFNFKREIEILCTLRTGLKKMTTRLRVSSWIAEYGETRNVQNIVTKQVFYLTFNAI
jgi:hypothetical protein